MTNVNRFKNRFPTKTTIAFAIALLFSPTHALAAPEVSFFPLISETLGMVFLGTGLILVGTFGRKKCRSCRL
jgi:hypothetical protein